MIIKKVTQTIYITSDGKNRSWLELDDFNDSYDAHVSAFISGECVADSIKICSGKQEILLPEVHETCGCSIVMKGQNGLSQCFICTLKPVKKWRISFINSSHEDLGYEDYVNRLGEGCLRLTKRAMDIIDTYPDFHYSIEHYWWLRSIEQYGDDETFARLRKYFDSGNIDLMFPHCGVHTHWHGYEQLPRSTYYSGLYARKRWGIRARSVMFADISGMSWSALAAYADAGVEYVMSLYNSFRDCPDNADMPQCFWWMAPDGRRKVLMWTQSLYREKNLSSLKVLHRDSGQKCGFPPDKWPVPEESYKHFDELLQAEDETAVEEMLCYLIEKEGEVPYDMFPVTYYMDREPPLLMLKVFCDRMKARWAYPVFETSTPTKCMGYIAEKFGEKLPSYSGDLTDQWTDFAAISPEYFAKKRNAEYMFPIAETLSLLKCSGIMEDAPCATEPGSNVAEPESGTTGVAAAGHLYPKARLDEAMFRMCEFDEHCWATSIKNPIEEHVFNHNLVKEQSAITASNIVNNITEEIIRGKEKGWSKGVNRDKDEIDDYITAWNFLPERRKCMLKIPAEIAYGRSLDGKVCQPAPDGGLLVEPLELPAYGMKSYRLTDILQHPEDQAATTTQAATATAIAAKAATTTATATATAAKAPTAPRAAPGFTEISDDTITAGNYIVRYNKGNGRIISIHDMVSDRELLDPAAKWPLAAFLFVTAETKTSNHLTYDMEKIKSFRIENGPLAVTLIREGHEEQSGAVTYAAVTFYRHDRKIDVDLHFEGADSFIGDFYDRYRKNIFYSFPFNVKNHRFITELAAGAVDETKERLPLHLKDFVVTQNRIVAEGDDERGIALFTREMPVFHLGGIHYNNLSGTITGETSHIYLYAASNRTNQLNYRKHEDCFGKYHLSILPYEGGWQHILPDKSAEFVYEPVVGPGYLKEKSYIELAADNLRMTAFKKAEDGRGIIARFAETSGKAADASLKIPFEAASVRYTNIVEEDSGRTAELSDEGNVIHFRAEKFSYTTLRIIPKTPFSCDNEPEDTEQVRNVFVYNAHDRQNVVCWEKYDHMANKAYDIYCDGKLLATAENEPFTVQFYLTGLYGKHTYEVRMAEKDSQMSE